MSAGQDRDKLSHVQDAKSQTRPAVVVASEQEMKNWGARLASAVLQSRKVASLGEIPIAMVVTLDGELGAGKTRFVQGFCAALGVDEADVTSPTFTLIQEYPSDPPIFHFDAYRLEGSDELERLGFGELLDSGGVILIEWGSRVAPALPKDRIAVRIDHTGDGERSLTALAGGSRAESLIRAAGFPSDL